ncbi:MAG: Panacea domain-containing protein [Pseudonocardiaceae bacterium]
MTLSAHDVAAVLRDRLPGLPTKKLHKLLYYCQGHHLAAFDESLFGESISAWDMGPVVGTLWYEEKQGAAPRTRHEMNEAQLNTIGYVLSRYGALTG